jgi:hypothetical protein
MLYLLVGAIPDGKPFRASPGIALNVNGRHSGIIPFRRYDFGACRFPCPKRKAPACRGFSSKIAQPLQRRAPSGAQRTL